MGNKRFWRSQFLAAGSLGALLLALPSSASAENGCGIDEGAINRQIVFGIFREGHFDPMPPAISKALALIV